MYLTLAAGGFSFLERAVFKSIAGIDKEFPAFRAELVGVDPARVMIFPAITADHHLKRFRLPPHAGMIEYLCFHSFANIE